MRLCRDVCKIRIKKEGADEGRNFLKAPEGSDSLAFQVIFVAANGSAETGVLHVVPHPFIRVQFR